MSTIDKRDSHAVYWPRGQRTVSQRPLAPRLPSLDGKTVAFLWDYLFRGDEFFPMIEAELHRRYKDVQIVPYQTFGSTHGDDERSILESLPARLKELKVDAVISAIGC